MKICFLNPPRFQQRLAGDFFLSFNVSRFSRGVDVVYGVTPPTELATLAAVARSKGHDVSIIDANALNLLPRQVCELIRAGRPDWLVIKAGDATLTDDIVYYHYAESMGIPTVFWEDILNPVYSERLVNDFRIRRMLHGEPEITLFDFIEGGRTGVLEGKPVPDLDALPVPLMEALPMDRYRKEGKKNWYAFLQRGCSWEKCSFCLIATSKIPLRMRSIAHIRRELDLLKGYGMQTVYYWEPEINPSRERTAELCSLFAQYPFKWESWCRADVIDREILKTMRASGCFRLHVGVENGDQSVLDHNLKGIKVEQTEAAFRYAREAGIETVAYLALGTPEESAESFRRTIALIGRIRPTMVVPASFRPFPSIPMTAQLVRDGYLSRSHYDLALAGECFGTSTVTRTKYLSEPDLARWIGRVNRLATRVAVKSYLFKPGKWKGLVYPFIIRTLRAVVRRAQS